jgi:hypothetical protein
MNYTTLYILDYTAELVELTYDAGVWTRKYVLPALVAVYAACYIIIEYLVRVWRRPNRTQMIEALCLEYADLEDEDPSDMDTIEFRDWLLTLSDAELAFEYSGLN